jgi:putative FmdB family regulatory protein
MEGCGSDRELFEDAMPLYEYRCQVCGELEEKIQAYAAPIEHDCSKCGSNNGMKRQISQVAFNLSGGGWYAQGYSDKGSSSQSKEASPAPSPGGCCGGGCACKPGA